MQHANSFVMINHLHLILPFLSIWIALFPSFIVQNVNRRMQLNCNGTTTVDYIYLQQTMFANNSNARQLFCSIFISDLHLNCHLLHATISNLIHAHSSRAIPSSVHPPSQDWEPSSKKLSIDTADTSSSNNSLCLETLGAVVE